MPKTAIIVGAGPAGLTAAYELLTRTDIIPIILEKSQDIGGISKTVNYKGNRMDIGGHRFFSKSDRVMQWWMNLMPIEDTTEKEFTVRYHNQSRIVKPGDSNANADQKADPDKIMLIRNRLSRIYFLRKFFSYPIQLSLDTVRKLGFSTTVAILLSYLKAGLFPRKPEKTLEDFMINRFGSRLYRLFFKDYTEKVWGVPCNKIPAEWGAQRIKGISIGKAIAHALKSTTKSISSTNDSIAQKKVETSLIERFLYPKFGPGQLWEEVASQICNMGGTILFNQNVTSLLVNDNRISGVESIDSKTGETTRLQGDYFVSTMPVKELITAIKEAVPPTVQEIAAGLQYRDFITVGVLLRKSLRPLPDTWIYVQERDVKVGRLQVFNNWSPYLVRDPDTTWLGMEYFCNTTDSFWQLSDEEIKALAISELISMGLASQEDVLDSTVLRVEKTYPAYFGAYERFDEVRAYTDKFSNLFLVGRNGMHKYNNSDHSMLTAMVAVDNIVKGLPGKDNIWSINTEQEYHEEKVVITQKAPNEPARRTTSAKDQHFKDYLFSDKISRFGLYAVTIAIIIELIVFKMLYPYAGFINGDSYVYLQTAFYNYDINTYPIGYPKFLRLISVFTKSDTALVAIQYLLLQGSILYFLLTIFYFYRPTRPTRIIVTVLMVLNPVLPYLANYVSSDALFISLSIIWFTLLIWILNRSSTKLLVSQAVILLFAFTVRYNALYYPIIGLVAFALIKLRFSIKLVSQFLSLGLIAIFVLFTSQKYYDLAGKKQFSPFTGWQMANNAMYAYKFVDRKHITTPPDRFRVLDKMVRTYFDTTQHDLHSHPEEMLLASTVYMWDPNSPLQQYMNNQFKKDSSSGPVRKWATVAPLFADYGTYLIKKYPVEFAKFYLWPNTLKYYAPPVEFLEDYNMGIDSVQPIAQDWFGYKTNKVTTYSKDLKVRILNFFPVLVGALNVLFILGTICFFLLSGARKNPLLTRALLLAISLWVINFGFSVFASPIALRFQMFPILVFLSFAALVIDFVVQSAVAKDL